jgi:hypothetical protein
MRNNSDDSMAGSIERMKRKAIRFDLFTGPSATGFSRETEEEMAL